MKKVKYMGIVRGCKTYITFPEENAKQLLARFCNNYGADLSTFKEIK